MVIDARATQATTSATLTILSIAAFSEGEDGEFICDNVKC
jgi:hypothetical protein